jgi:DUF1680 family protein
MVRCPLAANKDELDGLHANTQVPKWIGAARQYKATGEDFPGVAGNIEVARFSGGFVLPSGPNPFRYLGVCSMNEVMADIYHQTGDERWLTVAQRFDHAVIFDPLGVAGNIEVARFSGGFVLPSGPNPFRYLGVCM